MKLKQTSFLKKYGKKPLLDVRYSQEVVFMWKKLKNGQNIEFKRPEVEDCASLVEMMKTTYKESNFLTRYEDEFNITVEDEIRWINRFDHQTTTMMIVKDGDKVIGNASINLPLNAEKTKHRCGFGIAIIEAYHGMGVGRLLTREMIQFAKNAGYEQIELEVACRNYRAIQLYMSEGFVVYGKRPNAFKCRDGHYEDEYLMVLDLR